MNKYYLIFLISLFCISHFSCNKKQTEQDQKILSVDITPHELAASDLFKKIEIIPLETNEQSFIVRMARIIETNDRYYILDVDKDRSALLYFDKQGKFISKIGEKGDGPGEFSLIYETIIKPEENLIYMLSPNGILYSYSMDGKFIKKNLLPGGGEQDMIELDKNLIAYWTLFGSMEENQVTFYDIEKEKVTGGFWKSTDDNIISIINTDVFYKYKNENYFYTQFGNRVYRFTKDKVEPSYTWDFGKDNLNLNPYQERVKEDLNILSKLVETEEIPYCFYRQYQNKEYYYTLLQNWSIDRWRNVFYRKKDGKTVVFDTLKEGPKIKDITVFTDEYMIGTVSMEEIDSFRCILSAEESEKIKDLKEDDNICLVKYYFK